MTSTPPSTSKRGPASRKNRFAVRRGALPPSAQVQHLNEDQWEEFIEEACRHRPPISAPYVYIKRLGGAGDGGRDVEARLCEEQKEGEWDLYQAKHYDTGITPSVFFPELAKFFQHLLSGTYKRPRFYFLCAPRNAGNDLHNLLANPEKFKNDFLTAWRQGHTGFKNKQLLLTADLENFIQGFDFGSIKECLVRDLIDWHSNNQTLHHELFGIEAERGDDPDAPAAPTDTELVYVNELLNVYAEHLGATLSLAEVLQSEQFNEHFSDQRSYFYCAEGLRQFSRDLYGEEEFVRLLSMVQAGIRPWLNGMRAKSGLDRLEDVLRNVSTLRFDDSILAQRLRPNDLPGSCHHLVNQKRVKWVK